MKLTVSAKSWLLTIAVALALLAVMLVGLFTLKSAANLDNRARLEQLLRSTTNTIAQFEKMAEAGKISDATAKEMAAQVLRTNKYHPSEYVYVTDEKLAFVAAPGTLKFTVKRLPRSLARTWQIFCARRSINRVVN